MQHGIQFDEDYKLVLVFTLLICYFIIFDMLIIECFYERFISWKIMRKSSPRSIHQNDFSLHGCSIIFPSYEEYLSTYSQILQVDDSV